jgi:hypothetical protein
MRCKIRLIDKFVEREDNLNNLKNRTHQINLLDKQRL